MKVNEIDTNDLRNYCCISDDSIDTKKFLLTALASAKSYIKSYCNISDEELNKHDDLSSAVFMYVYDAFSNRSKGTDYKIEENPAFTAILSLHDKNFL